MIRIYFNGGKLPALWMTVGTSKDVPPSNIIHFGAEARFFAHSSEKTIGDQYRWDFGWIETRLHPSNLLVVSSAFIDFLQTEDIESINCINVEIGRENLPIGIHEAEGEMVSIRSIGSDRVMITMSTSGPGALEQFLRTWKELTEGKFEPAT